MSVLVVEDEPSIRRLIDVQLDLEGFETASVGSLAEFAGSNSRHEFDAVILDLSLPDGSGLVALDELRRAGSTAHVVILSGSSAEQMRVEALGRGADDYVTKPFSLRELCARLLAVERRQQRRDPDPTLRVGQLSIDVVARSVSKSGSPLELTAKEFDLLVHFATTPRVVHTRDELLKAVWNSDSDWQQPATVTEHVSRLRSKIGQSPGTPALIGTVRGIGYRFDPPIVPSDTPLPGGMRTTGGSRRGSLCPMADRVAVGPVAGRSSGFPNVGNPTAFWPSAWARGS